MEDRQIVDLYWARSEKALSETKNKYGRYCYSIAYNILHNNEDSEECVSETYLHAWNSMPEQRPDRLAAFLGRITRNLALDELQECISAADSTERIADDSELTDLINGFLASMSAEKRKIFMKRYWYFCSVRQIAAELSISESKVKMSLLRSRNELKQLLEKEGVAL